MTRFVNMCTAQHHFRIRLVLTRNLGEGVSAGENLRLRAAEDDKHAWVDDGTSEYGGVEVDISILNLI